MIIVVSNLWPRQKFYENVPAIAARLEHYVDDPVFEKFTALYPLEKFLNDGRAGELGVDDEYGVVSSGEPHELVVRQFVFFILFLRAMLLNQKDRVSTIVTYCSGIIPVLNALLEPKKSDALIELSPQLLCQLEVQDQLVAENVLKFDNVMSIVELLEPTLPIMAVVDAIERAGNREAFITDQKSDSVIVVSGRRSAVSRVLSYLAKQFGADTLKSSRMVAHGGLHTPLAAPNGCLELDQDSAWSRLHEGVLGAGVNILSSSGQYLDINSGPIGLQKFVRSTLFDVVQTGRMTSNFMAQNEPVRYVGLPSVLLDMFIGTGVRPRKSQVAGVDHV